MKKMVFIGPAGGGEIPSNGASVKNYYIIRFLKQRSEELMVCDTEEWRKSPLVLIKLFWTLLLNRKARYILSANNTSSYRMLKVLKLFRIKDIVYWVIGGSIANWIETGKVKKEPYKTVKLFIVEGHCMKRTLERCGFSNVEVVPNFKDFDNIPELQLRYNEEKIKFIFLSRIVQDKGCDLIFQAAKVLNEKGLQNKFCVDFYGPVAKEYESEFNDKVKSFPNIDYCGFIDLRNTENYSKLVEYDLMIFPTYWHGEGFPGIFIDAFIAGLPVLATNWSMNNEVIKDGINGWLIESKNANVLADKMEYVVLNQDILYTMKQDCQKESSKFHVNNVLNKTLLEKINT